VRDRVDQLEMLPKEHSDEIVAAHPTGDAFHVPIANCHAP
jgi:hypothetical protein